MLCMGWLALELEAELEGTVGLFGPLLMAVEEGGVWDLVGEDDGVGRAPVRKRSESVV